MHKNPLTKMELGDMLGVMLRDYAFLLLRMSGSGTEP